MLLTPNLAQQLISRKCMARVSDEELQQLEFSGSQLYLFAVLVDTPRGGIEPEWSQIDRNGLRLGLRFRAPEMGFDASDQFTRTERLRNVIVAADLQAQYAVNLFRASCEKENRHSPEFSSGTNTPAQ